MKFPKDINFILSPKGELIDLRIVCPEELPDIRENVKILLKEGESEFIKNETLSRLSIIIEYNAEIDRKAIKRNKFAIGSTGKSFDPLVEYID